MARVMIFFIWVSHLGEFANEQNMIAVAVGRIGVIPWEFRFGAWLSSRFRFPFSVENLDLEVVWLWRVLSFVFRMGFSGVSPSYDVLH
jgi:hypothetical protein